MHYKKWVTGILSFLFVLCWCSTALARRRYGYSHGGSADFLGNLIGLRILCLIAYGLFQTVKEIILNRKGKRKEYISSVIWLICVIFVGIGSFFAGGYAWGMIRGISFNEFEGKDYLVVTSFYIAVLIPGMYFLKKYGD